MDAALLKSLSLAGGIAGVWAFRGSPPSFYVSRPRYLSAEDERTVFKAIERAIGAADLEYLRGQAFATDDLRRHTRDARKYFLRLYVSQCRSSFYASAQVARQFAADADDPELAFAVLRQTARFQLLSAALRLGLVFHPFVPVGRLMDLIRRATRPLAVRQVSVDQHAG